MGTLETIISKGPLGHTPGNNYSQEGWFGPHGNNYFPWDPVRASKKQLLHRGPLGHAPETITPQGPGSGTRKQLIPRGFFGHPRKQLFRMALCGSPGNNYPTSAFWAKIMLQL